MSNIDVSDSDGYQAGHRREYSSSDSDDDDISDLQL